MKKTFRKHHLLTLLNDYDFSRTPLDTYLNHYFRNHKAIGSKDRKSIADEAYTLVRWKGLLDHFCDDEVNWETRDEVLSQIKLKKKIEDLSIPPHIRASFPKTLFTLLSDHYGEDKAFEICLACNEPAPLTLRVNLLKTTRKKLMDRWGTSYDVSPTPQSPWGLYFKERVHFQSVEEFSLGFFEAQDEASQLVANLVEAKPGDQVLDFCAGSGGKTLAFAHKLQESGQIYLHDIRPHILTVAKKRLKRAGIQNGQILQHDAIHKKNLKGKMDWVLVDAPCSGTGTLRRNPDIKWKFNEEMLARLQNEQREIFHEALSFLKPNGKIVYSTCSILPQENQHQLQFFQKEFSLSLVGTPFYSLPTPRGMDGFFAVTFSK